MLYVNADGGRWVSSAQGYCGCPPSRTSSTPPAPQASPPTCGVAARIPLICLSRHLQPPPPLPLSSPVQGGRRPYTLFKELRVLDLRALTPMVHQQTTAPLLLTPPRQWVIEGVEGAADMGDSPRTGAKSKEQDRGGGRQRRRHSSA